MSKISREVLLERTTEPEVFQDMDNFELLNDSSTFALSLRLQFPKFSKGFTSSDFEPFVRSYVGENNLVSLGRLSFPNEWQMQVTNKEVRETLIRMGRTKINTRTCWITPLSQSEVRGFIHWIPTAVNNKKLETLLRAYGEVLLMENQKQTKWTSKVDSDARYFGLYLKSGKTMDDVPHFIRVSDYYGLITIRGRNPACFHCKEVGHRKSECKKFREKISDYSMRPPHSGKPRSKARGKRHDPKKDDEPKAMDQGIQTGEGIVTCPECLKEQLAVQKAAEESEKASVAEASKQEASAAEACDKQASAAEACDKQASAALAGDKQASAALAGDKQASAALAGDKQASVAEASDKQASVAEASDKQTSVADASKQKASAAEGSKQQVSAAVGNKRKEYKKKKEFNAKSEANREGPILNLAAAVAKQIKAKMNERKADSSVKTYAAVASGESVILDPEAIPLKPDDPGLGPLSQLEQLQRNVEEILARTKENLEIEFETSRQMLTKEAEKSVAPVAEGKKKKKRKKKKKSVDETVVEIELGLSTEPKDFL